MLRKVLVIVVVLIVALVAVLPAAAHLAPPCNDADGDGSPSGQEYAAHHISAFAKEGLLGHRDGHKPGSHRGFSTCLDVH
ncbi:MAG: hypothetical protein R3300_15970 [Candidatus Promineifilaceae bacterium]|nr:hypothetical protein [Candidatus Promineifilaceae bacterium]